MRPSKPWIDTAYSLIVKAREAELPVRLSEAVRTIIHDHPDCALAEHELAEIVRRLVIEERWSLDGS